MSAEWSSVAAARRSGVDGADAVVLLASDTDEGLRSAFLVAARYPGQLCYLDAPPSWSERPPPVSMGGVLLCRAPGLDLSRGELGTGVWQALGRIGRVVAQDARHTSRQVIFHLSGGYKAVIPYLMVMAETVRSVVGDEQLRVAGVESTVRAVALHESSERLVDIPVRRWPARSWAQIKELAGWLRSVNFAETALVSDHYDDLSGLLIDRTGARRTVNRYGWIMVNTL
jgi:hypothetical protein